MDASRKNPPAPGELTDSFSRGSEFQGRREEAIEAASEEDCSGPSDNSSTHFLKDYIAVVAITLAPKFSSYCFSLKSFKSDVRMCSTWGQCVGNPQTFKTPTTVLTDKYGQLSAFGYEALAKYETLTAEETDEYHMFENFLSYPGNLVSPF